MCGVSVCGSVKEQIKEINVAAKLVNYMSFRERAGERVLYIRKDE